MTKDTIKNILLSFTALYLFGVTGWSTYQAATMETEPAQTDESAQEQGTPDEGQQTVAPISVGDPAPDFTLQTLAQKSYSLKESYQRQPVLVEFFATWCPHCQHSTSTMKDVQKQFPNLQILAINAGDPPNEPSTTPAYVKEFKIKYPILEKPSDALIAQYQVRGIPAFYLVDQQGKIRWIHMGTLGNEQLPELKKAMDGIKTP